VDLVNAGAYRYGPTAGHSDGGDIESAEVEG
jgi:hypothetical protein